jgi:hypothetical protein
MVDRDQLTNHREGIMGDRVLMQCVANYGKPGQEVGPAVYLHWNGSGAGNVVRLLASRMADRGAQGDVSYCSARLVEAAIESCNLSGEDTGIGLWNQPEPLTADDSQGDAGCVLIHVDQEFRCDCRGGYLTTDPDGFPIEND